MEESNAAFGQVTSCITSGIDYTQNSRLIFDAISANSQPYNTDFLLSIENILQSKSYSPSSKFYALFLLVRITETKNDIFVNQLATSKNLLNVIFQHAQYDRDKPLPERGYSFFSKTPTKPDGITGKNYVRLALEALKFWSRTFGTTNKSSTLVIYTAMYKGLQNKNLKFPETFNFIGRSYHITEHFHLREDFSADDDMTHQNKASEIENEEGEEAFAQVISCINSASDYKQNSQMVIESVAQGSKTFIKSILESILEVLEERNYLPKSKFLALFLLVHLTEGQGKQVVPQLAASEGLYNKLFQDATLDRDRSIQERGRTIFSREPNQDQRFWGNCYVNLIVEALTFWNEKFSINDKKDPNYIFKVLYSTIVQKNVQIPKQFEYLRVNRDSLLATLEEEAEMEKIYHNQKELVEGKSQKVPTTEGYLSQDVPSAIKSGFLKMNNAKNILQEYLENNPTESEDSEEFLEFLFNDINEINNKDLQPQLDILLANSTPENEKYIDDMMIEGDFVDTLKRELASYRNKRIKYSQFRRDVLILLGAETADDRMTPGGQMATGGRRNSQHLQRLDTFTSTVAKLESRQRANSRFGSSSSIPAIINIDYQKSDYGGDSADASPAKGTEGGEVERASKVDFQLEPVPPTKPNPLSKFGSKKILKTGARASISKTEAFQIQQQEETIEQSEKVEVVQVEVQQQQQEEEKTQPPPVQTNPNSNPSDLPTPSGRGLLNLQPVLTQEKNPEPEPVESPIIMPPTIASNEASPILEPSEKFEIKEELVQVQAAEPVVQESLKNNIPKPQTGPAQKGVPPLNPLSSAAKGLTRTGMSSSHRNLPSTEPRNSRRKLSEEKLRASFRDIDQSISKVKASDLSEIENSIKKSFLRSGKEPPKFAALDEVKKKIQLEKQISDLRRERNSLTKETSLMRSHVLHGSFLATNEDREDTENFELRGNRSSYRDAVNQSDRGHEDAQSFVQEYQSRAEELKKKLEEANQELLKRNREIENLKRSRGGIANPEVIQMIQENAELKSNLEEIKKGNDIADKLLGNSPAVIPTNENTTSSLKSQLKNLNKKNEALSSTLEDLKSKNNTLSAQLQQLEDLHASPAKDHHRQEELAPKGIKVMVQKTEVIYGKAEISNKGRTSHGDVAVGSRSSIKEPAQGARPVKPAEFVLKTPGSIRDPYDSSEYPSNRIYDSSSNSLIFKSISL